MQINERKNKKGDGHSRKARDKNINQDTKMCVIIVRTKRDKKV
jgi:hypothetical protein